MAQITYSNTTVADAFLATGSADNPDGELRDLNFGAAGTMAVAPATADKGEFQSVAKFDFSDAVPFFNAAYGTNGWAITAISLTLTSNYGTAGVQPNNGIFNIVSGGDFVISWISTNGWAEGTGTPNLPTQDGVTYDSLPELKSGVVEVLCTNAYTPPGNNVSTTYPLPLNRNVIAEIESGGEASFLFYAADNKVGYLFNSYEYGRGNEPLINVTAVPFLKILSGNFSNDVFYLTGQGAANAQYTVQVNMGLTSTNWQSIGTAISGTNGLIQFTDTSATNGQRFYRLSE
ncbi:MAG TPA: hypothetical protein VH280_24120 [Verrucomicrobiae bacterium]|jgi:hypothetical protein|nr:hypothetical protein [Verrucomicrobiae bacterium]